MKASGGLQRDTTGIPLADRYRSSPSPSEASPFFSNHKSGMITITECVMHSVSYQNAVYHWGKTEQNKLYLVTLFVGPTTAYDFFTRSCFCTKMCTIGGRLSWLDIPAAMQLIACSRETKLEIWPQKVFTSVWQGGGTLMASFDMFMSGPVREQQGFGIT